MELISCTPFWIGRRVVSARVIVFLLHGPLLYWAKMQYPRCRTSCLSSAMLRSLRCISVSTIVVGARFCWILNNLRNSAPNGQLFDSLQHFIGLTSVAERSPQPIMAFFNARTASFPFPTATATLRPITVKYCEALRSLRSASFNLISEINWKSSSYEYFCDNCVGFDALKTFPHIQQASPVPNAASCETTQTNKNYKWMPSKGPQGL